MFKIEIKHHLFLLCLTTTLWVFFLLGGLWSEYYQTWPFLKTLLIVNIIPGIALIPIGYYVLKFIIGHDYYAAAIWGSFYGSIPLVLYDYLYIAVHLNKGMAFLTSYWYLTVFYFIPWLVLPVVAHYIVKQNAKNKENT